MGVGDDAGVLICSMINRLTACSNLPRGPAVKLTSLAEQCYPLRRSLSVFFPSYMREKGGRCLFVSMETNLGRTVCLGKGCERRASPSNQLEPYAEAAGLGLG